MCINLCGNDDIHEDKEMLERRRLVQGLAAGGVLTAAAPALTGCATNAETGG